MAPSAKKKALRRAAASESCLYDDAGSITSNTTTMSLSEWGMEDSDLNPVDAAIELIQEKRSSTREQGLAALVTQLATVYSNDYLYNRQETLTQLLLASLRKGGATEATSAARGLCLLAITLGAGVESAQLLRASLGPLVDTARASKAPGARALAAETLALLTLVAADDLELTQTIMLTLEGMQTSGSSKVQTAALRGWTLLLSALPAWQLTAPEVERHLANLAQQLQADDVEARTAAGEAVALLYDSCGLAELDGGSAQDSGYSSPTEEQSADGRGTSSSRPPSEAGSAAAGLDGVVARMRELATNRGDGLRRSKRDRGTLRSTFRDLVGVVEEGTVPDTRIKLRHGDVLVVDSLAGAVQLAAMRRTLAEGFQVHLQANPYLHQTFGFTPREDPAERLTRFEKRLYRSPNSAAAKQLTQHRKSHRADAAARKGSALGQSEW